MSQDIFVGREAEYTKFEQMLEETRQGNGKIVFLHGESGSGKTTLVRKFVEEHDAGCLIAISECIDKEGATPYAPFKQVLVQLNSDAVGDTMEKRMSTRERLMAVINESGPEWIAAIPVIGEITTAGIRTVQASKRHFGNKMSTDNVKNAEDIQNIYENELRRLSQKEPLIIFIDDLQWADQSSLNLLFVLGRTLRVKPFPILLIGSYRPHDIAMGRDQITPEGTYTTVRHPLLEVMNELRNYTKKESHVARHDGWLEEMSISPFDGKDIQSLVSMEFSPNEFPEDFCDQLRMITEGHPLFATEILGYLQQTDEIYQDADGKFRLQSETLTNLPTSIDGVITERVSHVREDLKKIIECASVNGEQFLSNIIEQVLRMDELELLDQLEELSQKHELIRAEDSELIGDEILECYSFTHRLIHNFVYQGIDAPKRRVLHKRIAKSLKNIYSEQLSSYPVVAEQIDRHLQIARGLIDGLTLQLTQVTSEEPIDEDAILEAAQSELNAAELSFKQYAMTECLSHCDKCLAFLSQIPELSQNGAEVKFLALRQRNFAQNWMGRYEEAFETAQSMLSAAEKVDNREYVFQAMRCLGQESGELGNFRQAIGYHEQSLILFLDNPNSPMVGQAYQESGAMYVKLGEYDRALELYQKALDIHKANDNRSDMAQVNNYIATLYQNRKVFDKAVVHYNLALELLTGEDDVMQQAAVLNNLGGLHHAQGNYDGAIEKFKMALGIHEKLEKRSSMHVDLNNIGIALQDKGDFEGAMENYKKALEIVEELNDRLNMAVVYINIGTVLCRKNQFDEAIDYHKKALTIAEELDDRVKMANRYNHIGLALSGKGDFDGAIGFYKRSLAINLGLGNKAAMATDYTNIGEMMRRKGDFDGAIKYVQKALRLAQKRGDRVNMAVRYNNIALLYQGKGDIDEAINASHKALSIVQELNDPARLAIICNNIGMMHLKKDNWEDSVSYFKRAIEIATEMNDQVKLAHFCFNLGKCYIEHEDYENALKFIEKATDTWYFIGKVPPNIGKTFDQLDELVEELEDKIGF